MTRHALLLLLLATTAFLLPSCEEDAAAGVPCLHVATDAPGGLKRVEADRDHREAGTYWLTSPRGDTLAAGRMAWMKGRGNSTWGNPKRPYNLKLSRRDTLLRGNRGRRRYCLLANYADPTAMRNLMVLGVARRFLPQTPAAQLVRLVIDGDYRGLYLLTEHMRKSAEVTDTSGYYLLDVNCAEEVRRRAPLGFVTEMGEPVALKSPRRLAPGQLSLLAARFAEMEEAVAAPDGRNPRTGRHYTELIDVRSFALYYLMQEVFLNEDAGMGSFLVAWEPASGDSCFRAGPVWDFDLAVGRPRNSQHLRSPEIFYARTPIVACAEPSWPGLLCALNRHADFRRQVGELYRTEVGPAVRRMFSESAFDSLAASVLGEAKHDVRRWPRGGAPRKEMRVMRDFMQRRLRFLDEMWGEGGDERMLSVWVDNGWGRSHHLAEYKVERGATFVPPLIDRCFGVDGAVEAMPDGWRRAGGDSLFRATGEPVCKPISVTLRWTPGTHLLFRLKRRLWAYFQEP